VLGGDNADKPVGEQVLAAVSAVRCAAVNQQVGRAPSSLSKT
jgi:hypothetical protein